MKHIIKLICMILALCFLLGSFVACDREKQKTVPTAEEYLPSELQNTEETASTPTENNTPTTTTKAQEKGPTNNSGLGTDFKNAMDSYEKFMDEYVAFMKKYKANPTDLSILSNYSDYLKRYSEFVNDFEKWENDDLNTDELAYYVDVQARVSKKLLEIL